MKDDLLIEIQVRAYYTSNEADVAPSTTVLVQKDGSGKFPDWDRLIENLVKSVAEQIHGAPFSGIRAMTKDEVDQFRADERTIKNTARLAN